MKAGVSACHFRINGCAGGRNDGKLLVFQSGNTIRAGKHSHEDALRSLFRFNQFVRRAGGVPHEWHAAIDHPNMVLSGKLAGRPREGFRDHWRCNYSQKFPGVAVKTGSTTTPEVYPKSGTFIMPGTRDVASLRAGLDAMADFSDRVRSGAWLGSTGKPLTTVVAVGIGGSYLGPEFLCEALK